MIEHYLGSHYPNQGGLVLITLEPWRTYQISMHTNLLMVGFLLMWDLVNMFSIGKHSVSAQQLVKRTANSVSAACSHAQREDKDSRRNVLHPVYAA